MQVRTLISLGLVVSALTVGVIAAPVSHATFRDKGNGAIAFHRALTAAGSRGAIFIINPNSTGQVQVTMPPANASDDQPDWVPHWTAGGGTLAFSRCVVRSVCSIYTVRYNRSNLVRLSAPCPPGGRPPRCADDSMPAYAPDGKHIAFRSVSGKGGGSIVVMDTRGRNRLVIERGGSRADLSNPQYDSDGKRILFVRRNLGTSKPRGGRAIFVKTLGAKTARRITPWSLDAGGNPDWSPTDTWIVFNSNVDKTKKQIYVVHPEGQGLRRVGRLSGGGITSASFAPVGDWIVYTRTGAGGATDIFYMAINGSLNHQVTRTAQGESSPDWGPHP
jgi:TolB protein